MFAIHIQPIDNIILQLQESKSDSEEKGDPVMPFGRDPPLVSKSGNEASKQVRNLGCCTTHLLIALAGFSAHLTFSSCFP